MDRLNWLIQKAGHSAFYLWLLNRVLWNAVPFNRPHQIKVTRISAGELSMTAGNKRSNRNHIHGVHACLLATLCEYVSGLSLLLHFSPKEYRIILKTIHMTYHYQAKTAVSVKFGISREQVERDILAPLKTEEAVFREFPVKIYDADNNHICTGLINWQIKAWKHVKLKA